MTHNQIDFQNYKETVRHNLASEQETSRHNTVYENETQRHNIATEGEVNRHNLVSEEQEDAQIAINDASQREQARHNVEMENIGYVNASAGMLQAQASLKNADTKAYEAETGRLSQREEQREHLRRNAMDRVKLRNDTRETDSRIKTNASQRFSNYVNSVTGGYRNVLSGNASLINSLGNIISSGSKALGGLLK